VEHCVVKITPGPNISRTAMENDASASRLIVDLMLDSGDSVTCKCSIAKGRQHYNSGFASCNRADMKCDCFLQCNSFMCLCRNGVRICSWIQFGF